MQYGKLPVEIMSRPDLTPADKLVYAALAYRRNTKTGRCDPGRSILSRDTSLSIKSVSRALKKLEHTDAIARKIKQGVDTNFVLPHLEKEGPTGDNLSLPTGDNLSAHRRQFVHSPETICPPSYKEEETNEETNEETGREVKKSRFASAKKSSAETHFYKPSLEAESCLSECWEAYAALPVTCNRLRCLKTLDRMAKIDKLPWDRIRRICVHAAREWVPQGFIGSPVSLREWTRKRDMLTWEAIERQVKGPVPVRPEPRKIMPARSW